MCVWLYKSNACDSSKATRSTWLTLNFLLLELPFLPELLSETILLLLKKPTQLQGAQCKVNKSEYGLNRIHPLLLSASSSSPLSSSFQLIYSRSRGLYSLYCLCREHSWLWSLSLLLVLLLLWFLSRVTGKCFLTMLPAGWLGQSRKAWLHYFSADCNLGLNKTHITHLDWNMDCFFVCFVFSMSQRGLFLASN